MGPRDTAGFRLPAFLSTVGGSSRSSSTSSGGGGGANRGLEAEGGLLFLGLGVPVTVYGVEQLGTRAEVGSGIYCTTGGAVLDTAGIVLILMALGVGGS